MSTRVVTSQDYDAQRTRRHRDPVRRRPLAVVHCRTALSGIGHARLLAVPRAHPHVARAAPAGPAVLHVQPTRPSAGCRGPAGSTRTASIRRRARVTFNSYALVIHAALLGEGVALGWSPLVDELVATREARRRAGRHVARLLPGAAAAARAGRDPRVPALAARRVRERVTAHRAPACWRADTTTRRVGSIRPEIVLICGASRYPRGAALSCAARAPMPSEESHDRRAPPRSIRPDTVVRERGRPGRRRRRLSIAIAAMSMR